jgi:membrane protein YqaA with SNARE-associated domain
MDNVIVLWLLFTSSFLSATLLPGSSEILLISLLQNSKAEISLLLIVATVGNSLGGFSNYLIGRVFPTKASIESNPQIARGRRYGPIILLLSWLPIIGDPLCLAAGYLRFNWLISLLIITLAKLLRYSFIIYITLSL